MDQSAVAIRLKKMLDLKAEKIKAYIRVLDKQKDSVRDRNPQLLAAYTWMEQNIIKELSLLQQVIEPLQDVYRAEGDTAGAGKAEAAVKREELERLEENCEKLLVSALKRNGRNRESLSDRMAALKKEIDSLKIPKRKKSPYSDIQGPSFIDIIT